MTVLAQALFVLLLWTLAGAAAWALFVAVGARMGPVAASEWNQAPTRESLTVAPDHAVLRRVRGARPGRDLAPSRELRPRRELTPRLAPTAEAAGEQLVSLLRN
jgi:hypothetical protein